MMPIFDAAQTAATIDMGRSLERAVATLHVHRKKMRGLRPPPFLYGEKEPAEELVYCSRYGELASAGEVNVQKAVGTAELGQVTPKEDVVEWRALYVE